MIALVLGLLTPDAHAQACTGTYTITQATSGQTRDAYDRFGAELTSGDYDGDGLDDLVIGTPEEDADGVVNSGSLTVHYGRSTGLGIILHDFWSQDDLSGSPSEAGDSFTSVLATGDFDGDGYDDVAIGTPSEDDDGFVSTGRVSVRYGSSAGIPATNPSASFSQATVAGDGHGDADRFGGALAAGDFDGDGYEDLAIGVPGEEISGSAAAGRVVIVYGSATGLDTGNSESIHQTHFSPAAAEAGDYFGQVLAAGDFNGDGYADLAIAAPGEDRTIGGSLLTNVGWVHIKFGSSTGLKNGALYTEVDADDFGAVNREYDEQGEHLTAGDIDGDGMDELVIGIPSKNVNGADNAGIAAVFFGDTGTDIVNNGRNLQAVHVGGHSNLSGQNFGGGVHLADLDDDGYRDVIVGVPRYLSYSGAFAVFFGNGTGSLTADTQWLQEDCMGGSVNNDQYFGQVLSSGDYDGDGRVELATGDYNHTPDQLGAVFVGNIDK